MSNQPVVKSIIMLVAACAALSFFVSGCSHPTAQQPESMAELKTSLFTQPPAWYIAQMKAKNAAAQPAIATSQKNAAIPRPPSAN